MDTLDASREDQGMYTVNGQDTIAVSKSISHSLGLIDTHMAC